MTDEQLHQLLDACAAKVIHDYDKVLLIESFKAAKASAFRAAYIVLWLSCIESLRRKFQELAVHDLKAVKLMGELASQEAEKRSIDEYLLGQAKEYGLITSEVFDQLEHIRMIQQLYSRPYGDQLEPGDFVTDASIVVDNVLSQPTRLTESRISEHFHRLTKELNSLNLMLKQRGKIQ